MNDDKLESDSGNNTNLSPPVPESINIIIQYLDSKNFNFQVNNNIKVRQFKEMISSAVEIESNQQIMFYCGRILSDEKTLSDYKIDNNKVIHLVKRQIKSNDQNSEPPRRRRRVRRIRFILEEIEDNSSNANSELRLRFNHLRQLINNLEKNFQILENSNLSSHAEGEFDENHQFTPADYIKCFTDTLDLLERVRPLILDWLQTLENNSNESSNCLILMRMVHYISHIFHSLTDFRVDPSNDSPISLDVVERPIVYVPDTVYISRHSRNAENESNNERQDVPSPPLPVRNDRFHPLESDDDLSNRQSPSLVRTRINFITRDVPGSNEDANVPPAVPPVIPPAIPRFGFNYDTFLDCNSKLPGSEIASFINEAEDFVENYVRNERNNNNDEANNNENVDQNKNKNDANDNEE